MPSQLLPLPKETEIYNTEGKGYTVPADFKGCALVTICQHHIRAQEC